MLRRFTNREGTASYTEVVHKSVGRSAGMVLEAAVAAFGLGKCFILGCTCVIYTTVTAYLLQTSIVNQR